VSRSGSSEAFGLFVRKLAEESHNMQRMIKMRRMGMRVNKAQMLKRMVVGFVATLVAGLGQARADILYSAPPDYTQTSFISSSAAFAEQEASPFVLATNATVTGADWWGNYFVNNIGSDSFTVGFYTGAGFPNSTAIATTTATVTRTDLGFTGAEGDEEFSYSASFSTPFTATAGTQYYVAILNSNSYWQWQLDSSGTNYFRDGGDGNPWTLSIFPEQDAFDLTGTPALATPEPATITLLTSGFLAFGGFGLRRWRRNGAK
jgi:hypothetical protein